ncbi:SCO family protein [Arcobacter porcinus]|uniref:SCO1/SenC n=1 Tax=Arcobacter porcinus TaxID=1935204 RepID=A0ABX2YG65_9BACT|nr:SCO family protein [Arcobacter porcinus]OCL89346.1 SCO1/SenC [Arcobacter porcinus]OCL91765.1 SCO1/SenC [Arcobacter porcinus]
MKIVYKILIALFIVGSSILLLEPLVDNFKENKNYSFNLDTADGEITKDDFKSKVLAVYFGYTFCPDVCPTSLSALSQAINQLEEEKKDEVIGLFISVDPNRDKLGNLKEYANYFHKNFIGASSTKENIDDIVKRYGSNYEYIYLKGSAIDYSVAHTSYIYIFDKDGKFVERIDHFADVDKIKEILEEVLRQR